jgi:hypothetical protein
MSADMLNSNRERDPVVTSAFENELDQARASSTDDIQARPGLTRRRLIALFLLFNLVIWLLVLWLVLR